MANRSRNRYRTARTTADPPLATVRASEPAVHRWPHPIPGTVPSQPTDPALQYISCALASQNELLSQIRNLLEQLVADETNTANRIK